MRFISAGIFTLSEGEKMIKSLVKIKEIAQGVRIAAGMGYSDKELNKIKEYGKEMEHSVDKAIIAIDSIMGIIERH